MSLISYPISLDVKKPKFQQTFITFYVVAVLAVTILLSIINVGPIALGQSKTSSVSIIKGASNPSTTEPYNLSPLTV